MWAVRRHSLIVTGSLERVLEAALFGASGRPRGATKSIVGQVGRLAIGRTVGAATHRVEVMRLFGPQAS